MKRNGEFESGDMVVAKVQGVSCSGFVHTAEYYMGKVVSYLVSISANRDAKPVSVPAADVSAYLPGQGFQS